MFTDMNQELAVKQDKPRTQISTNLAKLQCRSSANVTDVTTIGNCKGSGHYPAMGK